MRKTRFFSIIAVLIALSAPAYAQTMSESFAPKRFVFINEYYPDADYTGYQDLFVGRFTSEGQEKRLRSLLYFDAAKLGEKHITNAYLQVKVDLQISTFGSSGAYEVGAYKLVEPWGTNTAAPPTWNKAPKFEQIPISSSVMLGSNAYVFPALGNVVNEWVLAPGSNYGLMLKGINEGLLLMKPIDSVSLVVEYEETNECNKNNGVCRSACGSEEQEADFGCRFGQNCCIKREVAKPVALAAEDYAAEPRADFNGDGEVNDADTGLFKIAYDNYNELKKYDSKYDLDNDNDVDLDDFFKYSENFGKRVEVTMPATQPKISIEISLVPEKPVSGVPYKFIINFKSQYNDNVKRYIDGGCKIYNNQRTIVGQLGDVVIYLDDPNEERIETWDGKAHETGKHQSECKYTITDASPGRLKIGEIVKNFEFEVVAKSSMPPPAQPGAKGLIIKSITTEPPKPKAGDKFRAIIELENPTSNIPYNKQEEANIECNLDSQFFIEHFKKIDVDMPIGAKQTFVMVDIISFITRPKDGLICRLRNKQDDVLSYKRIDVELDAAQPATTPPPAPFGLQIKNVGSNEIDILWNFPSQVGFIDFRTERAPSENGLWNEIFKDAISGNPLKFSEGMYYSYVGFADSALTPSTNYCYRVRASNLAGNSPYSNVVCATTKSLPAKNCLNAPLTIEGTNKGSSQHTGLTQLYWTYQESVEAPAACFWSCKKGYHKDGLSCAPDVSLLPSSATLAVCKDARYDFNKDGIVNHLDSGDRDGNGQLQGSERSTDSYQPESSWKYSFDSQIQGTPYRLCPQGLYCAGYNLLGRERIAFEKFAKDCSQLLKAATPADTCKNPDYDLNSNGVVDVLDAAEILDAVSGIKSCSKCDLNKNGFTNSDDTKMFLSIISNCGGISKIDYNSDGKLDSGDLTILKGIYGGIGIHDFDKKMELMTLRFECFGKKYDFYGQDGPDGKLTQHDIGPNGGASRIINGVTYTSVVELLEVSAFKNKPCPPETFCAGKSSGSQDAKLRLAIADYDAIKKKLDDCNGYYTKYPNLKSPGDFTPGFIAQNQLDINKDGELNVYDFSAISKECPASKVCDLDTSDGIKKLNSLDTDKWLNVASGINLALGQPSIIATIPVPAQPAGIPSIATSELCSAQRFDFNKDGKVDLKDAGDLDGDGKIESYAELTYNDFNRPSSYLFSVGSRYFGEANKGPLCPAPLFCAGKYISSDDQKDFMAFASLCSKIQPNICGIPAYNLNEKSDSIIDVIDATILLGVTNKEPADRKSACPAGKDCDLDQNGEIELSDVKLLLSVASRCGGISRIDYDSNGRLDQIDINLLRNTVTGISGVTQTKKDIIYLKQRCLNPLYDFIGTPATPTQTGAPDGKVTREDVYETGQNYKNGELTSGIIRLNEEPRYGQKDPGRNCPRGTFCAGRIPKEGDIKAVKDILDECSNLYPKYPDAGNIGYFNNKGVIAANDLNNDGKLDESDLGLISSTCPAGKACDLDGNGIQDVNDVGMLQRIAALTS